MKTVVLYKSKTGFTKRYARWIAEELGCERKEYNQMKKVDFNQYDLIIYGGGIYAGKINGLKKIKNSCKDKNVKLVVFATGATPRTEVKEIKRVMANNFKDNVIPHYYMQAGQSYERMGLISKLMMKVLTNIILPKKTKEDREKIEIVKHSYDYSDKKYIKPLITYVRGMEQS